MTLTLSSLDQRRLIGIQRRLLSPFAEGDAVAWGIDLCDEIKRLLGADTAGYALPTANGVLMYSRDIQPPTANAWRDYIQPLDVRFGIARRVVALGAYTREQLWQPLPQHEIRSSPYYTDYIVPHRLHDGAGLACAVSDSTVDGVAAIMLFHDRPGSATMGQSGLELLRLIYPQFSAGIHSLARLGHSRAQLIGMLDELSEGVLACDARGKVLHANSALTAFLGDAATGPALYRHVERARYAMRRVTADAVNEGREPMLWTHVLAPNHVVRIHGSLLSLSPFAFFIVVSRIRASGNDLIQGFGLTAAECQVARLIAEGLSDREVAERLGISTHTARNHAAHIRSKMGLKSRAKVAAFLR